MSSNKRIMTVFGATGNQGFSVLSHLLDTNEYTLRGVCRNINGKDAKDLERMGVQMVKGDIEKDSMEELANVMKGSYGVFLMTNFWDPSSMQKEESQGRKLVDAARKAGVHHLLWSTLPNVEKISGHQLDVPHFTDKAKVEEYIRDLQKKDHPFEYVTFLAPSFYYQSFKNFCKEENGVMVFTLPKTQYITSMDIDEMGIAVKSVLKSPKEYDLKRIDFYGTNVSPQRYIEDFSMATGLKARLNTIDVEDYAKSGVPAAQETANTFKWFDRYTYYGPDSDRSLGDKATEKKLTKWGEWAKKQNWSTVIQRKA
jgi:uncharacterized protein YbjT (DUF2867 family)